MHIQIPEELRASWQARIERLVHLTLGPLRGTLRRARLEFRSTDSPEHGKGRYQCVFEASGPHGEPYRFCVQHRDGVVAIVSALARARRAIMRDRLRHRPRSAHD